MSESILSILFSITAFLYAIVGFGGGSTYNSLLVMGGFDFQYIPIISLTCNLVVVTGGLVYFGRAGHLKPGIVAPFLVASVPAAYFGGIVPISEQWFIMILGLSLLVSGLLLLNPRPRQRIRVLTSSRRWMISLPAGAVLGLLSGLTGIGGGIFLAPLMYLAGWARPRVIAASASLFIFVNSLAGLAGHLGKFMDTQEPGLLLTYITLPLAVVIGGQFGSFFGSGIIGERIVRRMTGCLVLLVGTRILLRTLI